MKTKMMKTLALVVGLAAGSAAMAAGNIYEIVPCTEAGTALQGPIASVKSPLVAGTDIYFKIRLPRTTAMKALGRQWTIVHHGMSEVIDDFYSPLSIGIYVSGKLTYAKYAGYVDSTSDIRDFIFKYTTKAGDYALPIRLAGNGGPAGYSDDSSEYVLLNDDNPILRLMPDGSARVFGSPWSGKTPCYKAEDVPAGAVVQLKQAPYNKIERMHALQAYATLMSSASSFRPFKGLADGWHRTLEGLVGVLPCYMLECLPDAAAAELCHSTIHG